MIFKSQKNVNKVEIVYNATFKGPRKILNKP